MTARQVFEGLLTELSKVKAPSLLLQDFNYFFNKAINQYINKRYNIYDINQQTTDDLRVLKATTILDPNPVIKDTDDDFLSWGAGNSKLFGATFEVTLPSDYLHMLNCICIYKLKKNHKCYDHDNYVQFPARRLTADAWSTIINDYYNRPLPERPYYYIHNVNDSTELPTNSQTDMWGLYNVQSSANTLAGSPELVEQRQTQGTNFDRVIKINTKSKDNKYISVVEREAGHRYGNASPVRCEIRYGKDSSVFYLEKVLIDYLKAPQIIRLTQEQVDLTEDTSQIMEFPDPVCHEIINELVTLVMENTADPRLQSHSIVTQSVANPVQQQTPQQPQQAQG